MESESLTDFDLEMKSMDETVDEFQPLFKMISDNKIPVSKKEGILWKERLELCRKRTEDLSEAWETIKDVYLGKSNAPSLDLDKKRSFIHQEDKVFENLLWANTIGINRETVMKLPHIEITTAYEPHEAIAQAYERAINNYMGQIGNSGLNCKEKLKKADISAQLTNRGIIRLDWNDKVDTDKLFGDIRNIEQKLAAATSTKEVQKLEGELYAANEKLSTSGMSGAQLTLIDPTRLFVDPNSQLESGLDADWMIEERIEFESILKAKYGTDEGTVYAGEKSKIESSDKDKFREECINYASGEDTDVTSDNLRTVKTYYVWDKLKKRLYLYQEGKWDYPLWVWEDPYGLERFFPYYILSYNYGVTDSNILPEAAYYLPLMNGLNKINSMVDKARDRAFGTVIVDKKYRINEKDLQNIAAGKPGYVLVDTPEGKTARDGVTGMITPGMENPALVNKFDLYQSIAKLCTADNITRGEEYKANTTNMAIQQYSSGRKVIIGVRVDALLAFYCAMARDILQLMIDRLTEDEWLKFVTPSDAQIITSSRIAIYDTSFTLVGDDTVEPTAAIKKQEAMQLAQILGQFAAATPAVSIVALKAISRAFNEVVITDNDWAMIFQSLQQAQAQPPQQAVQQQPDMVQQAADQIMKGQPQ